MYSRMGWTGHIACYWDKINACRIAVGKPEGKRPPGNPISMLEDNIKMDLSGIEWGRNGLDSSDSG
jgi:hypothetical protein